MLNISGTQRVKVWDIDKRDKYALVRMSSSRKEKQSGDYKNSTWSFVRFVGNAFSKIDTLSVEDNIVLKGAGISLEPYMDKDNNKQYPKNPQIVVFNWEQFVYENDGVAQGDAPPAVASSADEDLPF